MPKRPVHCFAVGRVISTRLPTNTGKSRGLQTYGQRQSAQSPHGIASEEGHSHNGAIFKLNRTSSCRSALGQNGYLSAMCHIVAADLVAASMAACTLFLCRDYREGLLATDTSDVVSHGQILHAAIADRLLKEHFFDWATSHYDLHQPT